MAATSPAQRRCSPQRSASAWSSRNSPMRRPSPSRRTSASVVGPPDVARSTGDEPERTPSQLDRLGSDIDPDRTVGSLRIGERQVVEIARALSGNARCLILDEPTAALSAGESTSSSRSSGGSGQPASPSSTSRIASTRCSRSPTEYRSCETALRCSKEPWPTTTGTPWWRRWSVVGWTRRSARKQRLGIGHRLGHPASQPCV